MKPRAGERALAVLALFCLAMVVFLAKASESTLPATDAAHHAALAMSATAHGLVPHLPIGVDAPAKNWGTGYNDHPFAFFYVSGWIMRALGPDAWSAKLLPCLLSVGCVMLTFVLGVMLRNYMLGWLAALMLLFSREFVKDGLNCHLDNVMLFFTLGSFVLWKQRRYALAGACAGLGMWFKTPVALMLFPTAVGLAFFRKGYRQHLNQLWIAFGIALFIGSWVWIMTGAIGGWDLVKDYWVRQLWGTVVGGRGSESGFEPLLFLKVLRTHYMPWSILLVWALLWGFWYRKWREAGFLVPLIAAAVVVFTVSLVRFKYEHYYVPAFPFLSLIATHPMAVAFHKNEIRFAQVFPWAVLLLSVVILCSPTQPSPESFPALRKFMALIQSYGDCSDRVLFVDRNQPYGGYLDYKNLVDFYTGHALVHASCAEASEKAMNPSISWVIASGDLRCLDSRALQGFKKIVRFGNQFLLSRQIPHDAETDLTPLARELKATIDCNAAPLPKDRYL